MFYIKRHFKFFYRKVLKKTKKLEFRSYTTFSKQNFCMLTVRSSLVFYIVTRCFCALHTFWSEGHDHLKRRIKKKALGG